MFFAPFLIKTIIFLDHTCIFRTFTNIPLIFLLYFYIYIKSLLTLHDCLLNWVICFNIFCTFIPGGPIIHLTNSSPNVLKVSNTLIIRQQCPELLSSWWLMTLTLRQYCFNMISNSEIWTANNAQNKSLRNLWMKDRTWTCMREWKL